MYFVLWYKRVLTIESHTDMSYLCVYCMYVLYTYSMEYNLHFCMHTYTTIQRHNLCQNIFTIVPCIAIYSAIV